MIGFFGPIGLPEMLIIGVVLVLNLGLLVGLVVLVQYIVRHGLDRRGIPDPSDQQGRPPES